MFTHATWDSTNMGNYESGSMYYILLRSMCFGRSSNNHCALLDCGQVVWLDEKLKLKSSMNTSLPRSAFLWTFSKFGLEAHVCGCHTFEQFEWLSSTPDNSLMSQRKLLNPIVYLIRSFTSTYSPERQFQSQSRSSSYSALNGKHLPYLITREGFYQLSISQQGRLHKILA